MTAILPAPRVGGGVKPALENHWAVKSGGCPRPGFQRPQSSGVPGATLGRARGAQNCLKVATAEHPWRVSAQMVLRWQGADDRALTRSEQPSCVQVLGGEREEHVTDGCTQWDTPL